jgi:hypothetical protein
MLVRNRGYKKLRRRRGWEDRLTAAGIDPKTRSLVDPVKFYAAVKRVIEEKAEKTQARKLRGFPNLSGGASQKLPSAKPPVLATLPKQKFDPTARFRKKITEGELPCWENPNEPGISLYAG